MVQVFGRGRQPQADMGAAEVIDLLSCLERSGITVWVDGGWGVDALLGEQTRDHDDLDLIARLDDVARLQGTLAERGYTGVQGAPPTSFEMVDARGHQVDVHPVSFVPNGDGVYKLGNGEDWVYPSTAFTGTGTILGRRVACLTPEVVIVAHTTGYALDEAHQRDAEALSDRFGIALPAFRKADPLSGPRE
jgi:lincosamide nucleotidyltransferase A/C/D/E